MTVFYLDKDLLQNLKKCYFLILGLKLGILIAEGSKSVQNGIFAANKYFKNHFIIEIATCANASICLRLFKRQIRNGINNFALQVEEKTLVLICNFIKNASITPNILSLLDLPKNCTQLIQQNEDYSNAILSALALRISQTDESIFFLVMQEDETNKMDVITMAIRKKLTCLPLILPKRFQEKEWEKLLSVLKKFPNSPVLFVKGETFFRTIDTLKEKSFLWGRTIAVNLNAFDRLMLLSNNNYRREAEKLYVISASDITERHKEISVLRLSSLRPTEANILGANIVLSYLKFSDSFELLKHSINKTISRKIEIIRLIPEVYLGKIFIQEGAWLRESITETTLKKSTEWHFYKIDSPIRVFTKNKIFKYAKIKRCSLNQIKVSAFDPSLHVNVYKVWNSTAFPSIFLIPNSHPKGFTFTLICNSPKNLEISCLGNPNIQVPVYCLIAESSLQRRRHIRSYKSYHSFQYNEDPENKLRKKDAFKNILPQIGACVGATGGCSFCFVFLTHVTSSVSPSACFGSCAVGIGGSCASLMALGSKMKYQYKYREKYTNKYYNKFTVICSELYEQHYISSLSYLADARFGLGLSNSNPLALKGYQSAALPIVYLMKMSPFLSNLVFFFAQPWIRHMEFMEGVREEDDFIGKIMTWIGIPSFTIIGVVIAYLPIILFLCLLLIRCKG